MKSRLVQILFVAGCVLGLSACCGGGGNLDVGGGKCKEAGGETMAPMCKITDCNEGNCGAGFKCAPTGFCEHESMNGCYRCPDPK